MIWLLLLCALGLPAGFLLIWRVPICGAATQEGSEKVSIIIPARNERRTLPTLLGSIGTPADVREVIVVDDASTDGTASVAREWHARLIESPTLAAGWTGKTWACHQGAQAAESNLLLFLDADTWFAAGGFERLLAAAMKHDNKTVAASVLPFHQMQRPYEELSLFFNILMAAGAGGFGALSRGKLFGQSLLIGKGTYEQTGGHSAVREFILENLALASSIDLAGGKCVCLGGRGTLNMRMFPDGMAQLSEGWSKAFADGAAETEGGTLAVSIFWLTALISTPLSLLVAPGMWHYGFSALYFCFALQVWWIARQLGSYRALTCLIYPLPLAFYFGLFSVSLYRKVFNRSGTWRGRKV